MGEKRKNTRSSSNSFRQKNVPGGAFVDVHHPQPALELGVLPSSCSEEWTQASEQEKDRQDEEVCSSGNAFYSPRVCLALVTEREVFVCWGPVGIGLSWIFLDVLHLDSPTWMP